MMKLIKTIIPGFIAFILGINCLPVLAQTSNPATAKPNKSVPATNNTVTDPITDKNSPVNPQGTANRTDSVVSIPKEGTSITTTPGTRNKKPEATKTTKRNKTSRPN